MANDRHGPEQLTRRIFLAGGLAAALGVSACGRTVLTGNAGPPSATSGATPASTAATTSTAAADVTGSYAISDATTGTQVEVTVTGDHRIIHANGLPDHQTGQFPNAGNPNTISAQTYAFTLPLHASPAGQATALTLPQPFGIAVNGVLLDPLAAEWYRNDRNSGWTIEAIGPTTTLGLDANNAHVQPTGAYHYHGIPTGVAGDHAGSAHSPLLGWAGDGLPIYARWGYTDPMDPTSGVTDLTSSYRLKHGTRPSGPGGAYDGTYTEDFEFIEGHGLLDHANGRFGVTPEYPEGTYHYVLTATFPYIPRFLVGTVAESFRKQGPQNRTR